MQPITLDILRQRRDNYENFLLKEKQPAYVQDTEELKKELKLKPDNQTNINPITHNMIENINKLLEIDNIINNTIYSIYNYICFNAPTNTDKFKDFKVISTDYVNPIDKYLSPFHGSTVIISDKFDNLIHNEYNEKILSRLKILFPEFKITLRYWMIIYISKYISRDTNRLIHEVHIELNADGSRITPINMCKEYFTFGNKEIKYYNSILIDWTKSIIEV
jgi:hypothetical protein